MSTPHEHTAAAAALRQRATPPQQAGGKPVQPAPKPSSAESPNDGVLDLMNWDYDAVRYFGFDRKSNG